MIGGAIQANLHGWILTKLSIFGAKSDAGR
jgi:hypothetical protein